MVELKQDTVVRRLNLPGSRIQDELVFFNLQTGKYYATGQVGGDIWEFLEASPKTVSEICEHVWDRYEVDRGICESDVGRFLGEMIDAGIVATD